MNFATGALAGACARHPGRVVASLAMAVVLAIAVIVVFLPGSLTTEGAPTNNPESERAEDALFAAFPPDPSNASTDVVVVRSEELTVDSPRFRAFVQKLLADREVSALGRSRTYLDDGGESLVSSDRHATLIPVALVDDDETEALVDKIEALDGEEGFAVAVTGEE